MTVGLDWDDPLGEPLVCRSRKWFKELSELNQIRVPRSLQLQTEGAPVDTSLHTFLDASQDAYGAVMYYRNAYQSEFMCSVIVASKTRVAPLSAMSVPRLELMGAVLALRMREEISKTIKHSTKPSSVLVRQYGRTLVVT